MPKTPACSPLKRAPAPRFTRSLLLSYADSPVQRSYVLPAEDTSDADEDGDDDELDIRAASPVDAPPHSSDTPAAAAVAVADEGDNRASTRRNSWTGGSAPETAGSTKASVAFKTLQSACQALVNAKRRSFELGERSVSATFNQLRSCSLSSIRYCDLSDPEDTITSDNNDDESPPSPAKANNSQESKQEQLERAEPEDPEQEHEQPQRQHQKKKRVRTASYQSALIKYLPTIFTRSPSTKSTNETEAGTSGLGNNDRTGDGDSEHVDDPNNNESTSDSENEACKQEPGATGKVRRVPRWPLRLRHRQQDQDCGERQPEGHA